MSLPVGQRRRRAVLYGRVSKATRTSSDGTTASVDQQLGSMLAQAEREGVTVVGPFRDDGISASRYANGAVRDGWEQTMQTLLAGEADELWTWEISRATRDRPVWAALINACIARRVLISVGGRLHDPLDPDDGFMLDLQAALAVRESAVTSKRILRDVAARATLGRPHGKIPYGYRREYDPTSGDLLRQVPDETTSAVIKEMARRVLGGESMYSITKDLNSRGVPSPETVRQRRLHGDDVRHIPWHPGEVKDQLLSPTNAGQRVHKGMVIADADWPAIISVADHLALVAKLKTTGLKTWRDGGTKHLLTGIATCGSCGARLRRVKNRGYPTYACVGLEKRGKACVAARQEQLDVFVEESLIEYCERPDVRAAVLAASKDEGVAEAAEELVELRARLISFVDAASRPDGISPETLAAVEARLRPQIADAELRAVPRSVPPLVMDMLGPYARTRWAELSVEQRRQLVRFLMRVVVNKANPAGPRVFQTSRIKISWLVGPDSD